FYCVANMPGAVPNTSTYALTNVTLPYALSLANHGWREALKADPALALGLNTYDGTLTNGPVAQAHGLQHQELADVLGCRSHDGGAHPDLPRPSDRRARHVPEHRRGLWSRPAPLRRLPGRAGHHRPARGAPRD